MNDFVKVSVIIPNYNHQRFLEQRINSVLNQTYKNYEVILLDDASSDGSRALFNEYANHAKVSHMIINSETSGCVFKQWIKGIELAVGKYIWIAESDDFAEDSFLESTVAVLEKNESFGMVFTDTTKVDENGQYLGLISKSKKMLSNAINNEIIINRTNFTKYLLNELAIINASSVLFQKKALMTVDFETLKLFKNTGDVFTYLGIVLNYDLIFLPKALNYMRFHSNNSTKSNKRSGQIYKDKILLFDHYLKDFMKFESNRTDCYNFFVSFLFLSLDHGLDKEIHQVIKQMRTISFIKPSKYSQIQNILFFYKYMMYKGRPYFLRERLKTILLS